MCCWLLILVLHNAAITIVSDPFDTEADCRRAGEQYREQISPYSFASRYACIHQPPPKR